MRMQLNELFVFPYFDPAVTKTRTGNGLKVFVFLNANSFKYYLAFSIAFGDKQTNK